MPNTPYLTPPWVEAELEKLRQGAACREIPPVDFGADRYLTHGGRRLLNLASNNYLGLAASEHLVEGAVQATRRYGASSGASRLVCGTYALYDELDAAVARFKGTRSALTMGSGYAANLAILTSLADRKTVVFADRLNHASLIDGVRLTGARHARYRHNDVDHLHERLKEHAAAERKIVVTDTVFSMDGDVADLPAMSELCLDYDALLVVDEAHATGIFGGGRGLAHEQRCHEAVAVHMGTFSKALGSHGAYVAASEEVIALIRNKGRSFIYSTALPPAVVGANLAALDAVLVDPSPARRLRSLSRRVRDMLDALGYNTGTTESQIIPVILGGNTAVLDAKAFLMERGMYVPAIRPPTVPRDTARLRLSLRADLDDTDLALLEDGFAALATELRL